MQAAQTHGRSITSLVIGLALALTAQFAFAAGGWHTSVKVAVAESKKTGKPILADFTGSDWCGWCIRLKKEVFSKSTFKKWAKKNVVLLELDYPRRLKQSAKIKAQNEAMKNKYNISGFPTILFLDAKGKVLGRSGYMAGGPKVWIANANRFVNRTLAHHRKFTTAKAAAEKSKRPVLVLLHKRTDLNAAARVKKLVRDATLVDFAEKYLEVAYIFAPRGQGPNTPERVAVKALIETNELADDGLHVVFLDAAGKTLYKNVLDEKMSTGTLTESLLASMPEIEYAGEWIEDYPRAKLIAAQKKRTLLLDFTGSNWCGWCIKLHKEVFDTDTFKAYAKDNLVLVKLDFPRGVKQDEAVKRQNQALARKYRIRGFPTLILLDFATEQLGQMGYVRGGPDPFLEKLKSIVEKK